MLPVNVGHVHAPKWACACFQLSMCMLTLEHVHNNTWACAHFHQNRSAFYFSGAHAHSSQLHKHCLWNVHQWWKIWNNTCRKWYFWMIFSGISGWHFHIWWCRSSTFIFNIQFLGYIFKVYSTPRSLKAFFEIQKHFWNSGCRFLDHQF